MADRLKKRDLRKEKCPPMPEDRSDIAAMTKWLNHHNLWTEANQYTPAEFAWLCLRDPNVCSEPRSSRGHRLWLPLGNVTNDAVDRVVEAAETDRDAFEYLRAWSAGQMVELDSPEEYPAVLAPFVQKLALLAGGAKGQKPSSQGKNKVSSKMNARFPEVAERLVQRYGCTRYRGDGNHEGTACDYIAQAVIRMSEELKSDDEKELIANNVYKILKAAGGRK